MSFKYYPFENLTVVPLDFLNFLHGSPSKNLTALHLGLLNFIQAAKHTGATMF